MWADLSTFHADLSLSRSVFKVRTLKNMLGLSKPDDTTPDPGTNIQQQSAATAPTGTDPTSKGF